MPPHLPCFFFLILVPLFSSAETQKKIRCSLVHLSSSRRVYLYVYMFLVYERTRGEKTADHCRECLIVAVRTSDCLLVVLFMSVIVMTYWLCLL